jgi:hypothetical protein
MDGEFGKAARNHATEAEIDRDHVSRTVIDGDHVTRALIDANHVTAAIGHVTAAVVDGRAGQVQADDGSWIPSTHMEFLDNFSKKEAETLPPHRSTDHAMGLETGTKLPYRRI